MELGCSLVHLLSGCDRAVSERQFAGEKRLEGVGMITVVAEYDLGDTSAHRNVVECEYILQESQHLYRLPGRNVFVSDQVIYGLKHSG
jgi:hypothetical protein